MTTTTLNIRVPPRRVLNAKEAAFYCGLPLQAFRRICNVAPLAYPNGIVMYDIHDLDQWVDSLKEGERRTDDDIIGRLG